MFEIRVLLGQYSGYNMKNRMDAMKERLENGLVNISCFQQCMDGIMKVVDVCLEISLYCEFLFTEMFHLYVLSECVS